MRKLAAALAALLAVLAGGTGRAAESAIPWNAWSPAIFERARAEHRFVLLDLEAVWCHWCHVMDAITYHDPRVLGLIGKSFIPVRVDQDNRPDIASRYENWGWPATVLFGPDGTEIAKLRGYYRPEVFALVLQATIDDPSPVDYGDHYPGAARSYVSQLPADRRAALEKFFAEVYDRDNGGWGTMHKFIDAEALTYALERAREGDASAAEMARRTIEGSFNLIDPVWGGAYQYSDKVDWRSPHFEKIMSIQAAYLRTYAMAYGLWGKPEYRKAADAVYRYLRDFLLSPEGGFYTSQDANVSLGIDSHVYFSVGDGERRKLGLPPVDTHRYARENGWAIGALAAYYDATGERGALEMALGSARWGLAERALAGGGFRHDSTDAAGPYLGDSLAMAQAFLDLYRSTADRAWLAQARRTADFIAEHFIDAGTGGFLAAAPGDAGSPLEKPVKQREENVAAVRLFNLLAYYAGEPGYRRIAEAGMGYLVSPPVMEAYAFLPGVLEVDRELTHEPVHVVVVGPKDDTKARTLYAGALAYPSPYKRAEWWDKREGRLPNHDVEYPDWPESAAFACTRSICSVPVTDPAQIAAALDRLDRRIR